MYVKIDDDNDCGLEVITKIYYDENSIVKDVMDDIKRRFKQTKPYERFEIRRERWSRPSLGIVKFDEDIDKYNLIDTSLIWDDFIDEDDPIFDQIEEHNQNLAISKKTNEIRVLNEDLEHIKKREMEIRAKLREITKA